MQKKIKRRVVNNETIPEINALHPLLARVYGARKINSIKELDRALDNLLPFTALQGMEQAVQLLAATIARQEKILIVGDFDADGATSTVVAIRALRSFGAPDVSYIVPNRFAFGYGLTPELVAVAKDQQPALIVTVDNGIANHAGVAAAREAGIRVLITDHHLAAATLPDANAIVNPNQPGDPFQSKNLAGVGVIFYVMLALRRHLIEQGWFAKQNLPEPLMSRLLDLVALGTVADLVPLDHNNRILVHHGLQRIRAAQCSPGIIALLACGKRDVTRVVASDLGFVVASRLNAAGRMDDMSLGIECLLTDDANKARSFAEQLNQLNNERRGVEQDMHAQALHVLTTLQQKLQGQLPRGICLFDESWHQGVIGILASRIKEKFNRPVIVFAPGNHEEVKGSGRSIAGFHLRDALALIDARHPGLLIRFGGHAMAAGLTLTRDTLPLFMRLFDEIVSNQLSEAELEHCLLSDGQLDTNEFNLEVAQLIREGGPWGQTFPEPLFDDQFRILDQRLVGEKHLKLRLAKDHLTVDAVAFFVNLEEWPNHRCQSIHAVYRLDINEYRGKSELQLIIEHLEPA